MDINQCNAQGGTFKDGKCQFKKVRRPSKRMVFGPMVWIIMAVLLAGGVVAYWYYTNDCPEITYATDSCRMVHDNPDCTCPSGTIKTEITYGTSTLYNCEQTCAMIVNPDSDTFQQDAVDFVKGYLESNCGGVCTDLECGTGVLCFTDDGWNPNYPNPDFPNCIDAVWGVTSRADRVINVECKLVQEWDNIGTCSTPEEINDCVTSWGHCYEGTCWRESSGTIPWRMEFLAEGDINKPTTYQVYSNDNYCVDPAITQRCEPPMNVIPTPESMTELGTCALNTCYMENGELKWT